MKKIIFMVLFLLPGLCFGGIGFYGNPTPVVIHKGTNAPVLVKLFDVDNTALTAAEIAAITKIEIYYRSDTGATPETVDSTSYAAGFDKTTYAARGEIMLKIGLVDFTAGRDRQAELIIYNATYTSGRVIGLLDMQISDEVEDGAILTDPLTGIAYKFKTISVAGQSSVVADSDIDTVTLIAGANVTLTTDPATDSITIAVDNGGGLADAPSDGTEYLRKDGAWVNPSASGSMVYPGAGIPLSTGSAWGTPITNNSASWNMAYGWGDHALGGYVTGTPWTGMGYLTAETDPDFTTWLSTFIDQTEDADADPTNEIQVADGVTITGAGTLADPFVAVGGAGAPEADPVFGEWLLSFDPFETGDETDPSFSTWLSTTPPIYTETDPDFATWLLSYDPFETADETDPVFGAWLIATPPLYSESDPAVGTHESTYDHDLIASALQSESDPDFTTWLSTTPPLYTETDPAVGTHESTYDHTLIGTALQSESDPTVDTSAEIVSIIGAGVYQAPGAYLTSLSGAVLTDQTTPQTIGATGSRLAMCWATDLTVTNAISGSVTGSSGSCSGNAATASSSAAISAQYIDWNETTGGKSIANKPTIPSGNAIIDWTTDQGAVNINSSNYTDTNTTYSAGTGMSLDGTTFNCTVVDTDTDTQLTDEQVQDKTGAMWTGNTETRATVTYQDDDGTIDVVVDDMNDPAETSASIEDIMTGADAVTTVGDTDTVSIVVGGVLKKITGANAKSEFGGGGGITNTTVATSSTLTITGNTIVDNTGQSASMITTMPACPSEPAFVQFFVTQAAQIWYIKPATGSNFWLSGTELADNHAILNNGAASIFQDSILFESKKDAAGNWHWCVYIIQGIWTDGGL